MSIQSEITRISGNVSDALDAVAAKGVAVSEDANSDDLAGLISEIVSFPSGGTAGQVPIKQSGADGDVEWGQLPTVGIADSSVTLPKIDPAAIDVEPTPDSNNLVTSGGVWNSINVFNFADNSDFTQWIAQAGIGGSHGSQAYGGDRWILDSGTITGDEREDGNGYENITLSGTIRQIVTNPPEIGTVGVDMISGTATASYADGEITITSSGGVIKNVGLYEGEYSAETFPKYQPKGYGAELVNCYRYFYVVRGSLINVKAFDQTLRFIMFTPVEMRIVPSISGFHLEWIYVSDYNTSARGNVTITDHSSNMIQLRLTLTSGEVTNGASVAILIASIVFNADL